MLVRKDIAPNSLTDNQKKKMEQFFLMELLVEYMQILNRFMSSTFLTSTINQAIKEFNDTIDRNIYVMFKVFNNQFGESKMAFVQRDTFSEPFYGRIEGFYWSEFEPLEPKARKITQEIRNYLKVR